MGEEEDDDNDKEEEEAAPPTKINKEKGEDQIIMDLFWIRP